MSSLALRATRACAPALVCFVAAFAVGKARAQTNQYPIPQQDLFYNYYVPAHPSGGVAAQLYPAPRPTPQRVGHTYITYQPLMSHEFMYPHRRTYWSHNPGSGMTATRIWWTRDPLLNLVQGIKSQLTLPFNVGFTKRSY